MSENPDQPKVEIEDAKSINADLQSYLATCEEKKEEPELLYSMRRIVGRPSTRRAYASSNIAGFQKLSNRRLKSQKKWHIMRHIPEFGSFYICESLDIYPKLELKIPIYRAGKYEYRFGDATCVRCLKMAEKDPSILEGRMLDLDYTLKKMVYCGPMGIFPLPNISEYEADLILNDKVDGMTNFLRSVLQKLLKTLPQYGKTIDKIEISFKDIWVL